MNTIFICDPVLMIVPYCIRVNAFAITFKNRHKYVLRICCHLQIYIWFLCCGLQFPPKMPLFLGFDMFLRIAELQVNLQFGCGLQTFPLGTVDNHAQHFTIDTTKKKNK